MRALLDTSVLIAGEQGRPLHALPDEFAISVMTIAELLGGVLAAGSEARPRRLETLRRVEAGFSALPVDDTVARVFAAMAAAAHRAGQRPGIVDMLIASTAVAHGLSLYTQDREQAGLRGVDAILV